MKFNTPYNRVVVSIGEVNSGELITIPDESFSIKDIVERFVRGLPIGEDYDGFIDDDGFDGFDTQPSYRPSYDLSDLDFLRSEVSRLERDANVEYEEYVAQQALEKKPKKKKGHVLSTDVPDEVGDSTDEEEN